MSEPIKFWERGGRRARATAVLALGIQACATGVIVRKDPRADLDRYHSYAWVTAETARELRLRDPAVDGPISEPVEIVTRPSVENRLKPIIEAQLAEAGFERDRSGKPDFYVTFYGKSQDENWVSTWTGMTPAIQRVPLVIFPKYEVSSARTYRDGVVYLTLYDRVTKRPAWTGSLNRSSYGNRTDDATLTAEVRDLVRAFRP